MHLAQREALRIPETDRNILYAEHSPARFHAPPDKTEDRRATSRIEEFSRIEDVLA